MAVNLTAPQAQALFPVAGVRLGTAQAGIRKANRKDLLLIALDECYDRVSLGEGTRSENIDYFVELADRLGFQVVDEAIRPEPQGRQAAVPVPA